MQSLSPWWSIGQRRAATIASYYYCLFLLLGGVEEHHDHVVNGNKKVMVSAFGAFVVKNTRISNIVNVQGSAMTLSTKLFSRNPLPHVRLRIRSCGITNHHGHEPHERQSVIITSLASHDSGEDVVPIPIQLLSPLEETEDEEGTIDPTLLKNLASFLISQKTCIVHQKRIAMVVSSSSGSPVVMDVEGNKSTFPSSYRPLSWIGSLLVRLGAISVHFILSYEVEQKVHPTADPNAHKFESPLLDIYDDENMKENYDIRTLESAEVMDMNDELDAIVLSTSNPNVVNEDPFVNDFLRRTDVPIYMGAEFVDEFCYHARIQEGANITLWY